MAKLQFPIVVKCKECGSHITLEDLETKVPDPEGEILFKLAKQVADNALCPWCKARKEKERIANGSS